MGGDARQGIGDGLLYCEILQYLAGQEHVQPPSDDDVLLTRPALVPLTMKDSLMVRTERLRSWSRGNP